MLRTATRRCVAAWAGALAFLLQLQPALAWDVNEASSNLGILALTPEELAARKIKLIEMGELVLPTGEIVVADPLVTPDRDPLARRVKPGKYPVTLYGAQGRNAVAVLRFAPSIPVKWELATLAGQDIATLKKDEIFGYPVDAGTGSFMDKAAYPLMLEREKREIAAGAKDFNYYDGVLASEYGDYVMHRPIPESETNVAVFSSGWGDGFYASFWGLDAAGEPLVLMTDFGVLENSDARNAYENVNAEAIAAMTPQQVADITDAYAALQKDDLGRLQSLLTAGKATPESYIAETGFTLTLESIRHLKPKMLELLIRYGARPEMPRGMMEATIDTYPAYARQMTQSINPNAPVALELLDVVARWEAGAIPPADDAPGK